ncbi:hypothetical protein [Deinococcus hopiensis]|uniref:Uncharacterized protein n=1 Tax=Deinococcus hopiensis KR-140 TaxID=695939 RepID=A0A1W1VQ05_9DEIO|nr:hypothetical protein [Deinococcus hopiensis]SMB95438.1 hypothetical protein SAMN00790413_02844 [Deinococcus hopiensis KR-140]
MTAPAATRFSLLPSFLLGWALGAGLFLLVRAAGLALLQGPCQGRTILALLMPLLLGPGGLALTAASWTRGQARGAVFGLGLVVASLFPALGVGARDIGLLRASGCAGGYMLVLPQGGGRSLSEVNVAPGGTLNLRLQVGGYTPQSHPGSFALRAASPQPGLTLTLPQAEAQAGENVPLQITAARSVPVNTYTLDLEGVQKRAGQTYQASGTITVNVRP